MRSLNLLPWRAMQRQRATRDFYRLLACTSIIALLVLLLAAFMLDQRQRRMDTRARWLTEQTQGVRMQVRALAVLLTDIEALRLRTRTLNELQRQRFLPLLVLQELAALTPPNVVLQSLRQSESRNGAQKIVLSGYADTGASVAGLMDALREARSLSRPQLQEMHQSANGGNSPNTSGSTGNASSMGSTGNTGSTRAANAAAAGIDFRIECDLGGALGAALIRDRPVPRAQARAVPMATVMTVPPAITGVALPTQLSLRHADFF